MFIEIPFVNSGGHKNLSKINEVGVSNEKVFFSFVLSYKFLSNPDKNIIPEFSAT
jgi:hypothetical protein